MRWPRFRSFGTLAEFKEHLKAIRGDVTWLTVPGAHDPRGQDEAIADFVRK